MKRNVLAFVLIAAAVLWAGDNSLVTVKDSTVNNGVVIVTIQEAGKSFELQCNASSPNCTSLKAGTYLIERLPKNHGLYDCDNVDIYAQSTEASTGQEKLGEYCISQK